jgi:hypothetical protein
MPRRIEHPADTPPEAYHYWHRRWCEILSDEHREAIVAAGLAGASFSERVPDAPDGASHFSYAFDAQGRARFTRDEGEAIAEYDGYALGFRMLSDADFDASAQIDAGRFRILSQPERWSALMSLLPRLRSACQRAIEEAEREFDLELPRHW